MHESLFLSKLERKCQENPGAIALPESLDPRIFQAAEVLLSNNTFSKVVLFSEEPTKNYRLASAVGINLKRFADRIVWANDAYSDLTDATCNKAVAYQKSKGRALSEADLNFGKEPLAQAGVLLDSGDVDVVLAGAVATTAEVIRAAIRFVGLAEGCRTVSGAFVLRRGCETPGYGDEDEVLLFADAAVVVEPTQPQLVDIAYQSAQTFAQLLGGIERVAMAFLSFSTHGSPQHPAADKTVEAFKQFGHRYPSICADGELQFDAAYLAEIAQRKCPNSPVRGAANCFIFPDLNSGNIAYKIAQRLGGFEAFGPILQGIGKPYSDLSRGASVNDIVVSAYINRLRALGPV